MRILIVDDDAIALAMLKHGLEHEGHTVITCSDGEEALTILRRETIRLVITDWMMPRMNGLELCRHIRNEEFPGYVYVIVLTSRGGSENVVAGLLAGADDFLTKPCNRQELHVRVRAAERILALETRDVAIFALAKLAESRDPETGEHLERVRAYARLIAQRMLEDDGFQRQVDAEFVRHIYLASPLHDIGKVGIPDAVLRKPGRLTRDEFEVMKSHTTIGAATLDAAVRQFPGMGLFEMARDIAMTHHERLDGSGYPQGLRGEAIPLSGRIVALADVYDALTSKRPYKEAFSHEHARGLILRESGRQFDANIVGVFVDNEEAFRIIREQFRDPVEVIA